MNRMTWIAGGLLIVLAAVVATAWYAPGSSTTSTVGGGKAGNVKVDAALASEGEATASSEGCTSCHSIDGSSGVGPTWGGTYGTEIELDGGGTAKVDDAYLKESILDPGAQVHAGFGPSMPSYQGKLSTDQVKGLVEYIKSLGG